MALYDNKIFIVGGATSKGYSNSVLIYNENDLNEDPKTGPSNIRASRSPACTIFERLQNISISEQNIFWSEESDIKNKYQCSDNLVFCFDAKHCHFLERQIIWNKVSTFESFF